MASSELVRWRDAFREERGRDPTLEDLPEDLVAKLRELQRNASRRATLDDEENDSDSDSHVSASPKKGAPTGGIAVPRRSRGRLPGSSDRAMPPKRPKITRALDAGFGMDVASDAAAEVRDAAGDDKENAAAGLLAGARVDDDDGAHEEPKSGYLGNLFNKVADILGDPEEGPQEVKGGGDRKRSRATWRPRKARGGQSKLRGRKFTKFSKITQSNFCQVSKTGRGRGGGGGGRNHARGGAGTQKRKRQSIPFETLLAGDIPDVGPAAPAPAAADAGESTAAPSAPSPSFPSSPSSPSPATLGAPAPTQIGGIDAGLAASLRADVLGGRGASEGVRAFLSRVFGFSSFRKDQLEIVARVLAGQSTLVVKPTGYGKSLLYILAAALADGQGGKRGREEGKGVGEEEGEEEGEGKGGGRGGGGAPAIVVSPLLSLMKDQMGKIPDAIPHAMICRGMPSCEISAILRNIRTRKMKGGLVMVSPERLYSKAFLDAFLAIGPPPPFVCVDEAHCISEWGHSFRPAYFRLGSVLREALGVTTFLALTATATQRTKRSILDALSMEPKDVVEDAPVRANLSLHVRTLPGEGGGGGGGGGGGWGGGMGGGVGGAADAILGLLARGGDLASSKACIVYCTFQADTERIASHLYTHGIPAKAYHAGLSTNQRTHCQDLFCRGRLRVVVATVAFGMGLDKRDVDAIVHAGECAFMRILLSFPFLSFPFLPFPSLSLPSHPFLSFAFADTHASRMPFLSVPIYPILPFPFPFFPFNSSLSSPFLSSPFLSFPLLSFSLSLSPFISSLLHFSVR